MELFKDTSGDVFLPSELETTPITYLLSPLPPGGFPLENEDLITLQESARTTLLQVLAGFGTAYVLNGCIVSSINTTAKTCKVSSGYVYLDNAVRFFPGRTGAYPFYVVADTDSVTQKSYEDGNAKDTYRTYRAKAVTSIATGTAAIQFNPQPLRIKTSITAEVDAKVTQEITDRQNAVTAERTARETADDTERNARIAADTNLQNTKANKSEPVWQDLTLENGWTDYPSERVQYYKDDFGFVHLRGTCSHNSYNSSTTMTIGTLPSGFRPTDRYNQMVCWCSGNQFGSIWIGSSGQIEAYNCLRNQPNERFVLTGLSFAIN